MRIQRNDLAFAAFVTGLGAAYYVFMKNYLPKDALKVHGAAIALFGVSQIAFRGSSWKVEIPASIFLGAALSYQQTLSKANALSVFLLGGSLSYGVYRYHGSVVSNAAFEVQKELEDLKGAGTERQVKELVNRLETCLKNPRLSMERKIGLGEAFLEKIGVLQTLVDSEVLSNVVAHMEPSQQDQIYEGIASNVAHTLEQELKGLETSKCTETHARELVERFDACLGNSRLFDNPKVDLEAAFSEKIAELHSVIKDVDFLMKVIRKMEFYQQEGWIALDTCVHDRDFCPELFEHMQQTEQNIVLEAVELLLENDNASSYTSFIQYLLSKWRTHIFHSDEDEKFIYQIVRVACDVHDGFALTFLPRDKGDLDYWPIMAILYDKGCLKFVPQEDPFKEIESNPGNDKIIEAICDEIFSERLFPFVGNLLTKITDKELRATVFKECFEVYFTGEDAIDPKWIPQWRREAGLVAAD